LQNKRRKLLGIKTIFLTNIGEIYPLKHFLFSKKMIIFAMSLNKSNSAQKKIDKKDAC
jgi:hypothetical protein